MARARITFNDGSAKTLQSDYPDGVFSRFRNWIPGGGIPQGDTAIVLADESIQIFRTSTRYGCSFEIHGLFMGPAAGSSADIAADLKAHLIGGGACQVITEDALSSTYASCGLMPGTVPSLDMVNYRTLEYVMKLALINRAATKMICHYSI